jgi:glycosyltransferase involved in cell wall biosynthesis
MAKKSILLVSDFYHPHWTGITKGIKKLVCELGSEFDFRVVTIAYTADLKETETIDAAKVIRAKPTLKISRGFLSIEMFLNLIRQIFKTDLVLINSPSLYILPASILAKLFGKKLVIFHQGDLILRQGLTNRIIEWAFDFCTKCSCYLADVVSTYTQDYCQHSRVLSPFQKKFRPLLMPIPLPKAQSDKSDKLGSLEQAKIENKFIFGLAGRFVWEKGYDLLFQAIPKVIKEVPAVHFAFAGPTAMPYEDFFSESAQLYESIKPHVSLLGLLGEEDLAHFYKQIDCVVISSRSDCFNLVQAEACLAGVPSIVTNIPGARWLVKTTGFGLVAETEDVESLAKTLIQMTKQRQEILSKHSAVYEILNDDKVIQQAKDFFWQVLKGV